MEAFKLNPEAQTLALALEEIANNGPSVKRVAEAVATFASTCQKGLRQEDLVVAIYPFALIHSRKNPDLYTHSSFITICFGVLERLVSQHKALSCKLTT